VLVKQSEGTRGIVTSLLFFFCLRVCVLAIARLWYLTHCKAGSTDDKRSSASWLGAADVDMAQLRNSIEKRCIEDTTGICLQWRR
jgi:hypothetical protein